MGVGIDVQDLNAWFGKAQVLYDIKMKIEPGHVTAIIGRPAAASRPISVLEPHA